jgi:protein TonB
MVARYAIGVGLGALVTFLLFFLMQAIIATNEANLDEGVKGKLLDFVRLQDDQDIETKQRKPKPPPPPDEPPPDMPKPEFEASDVSNGVDVGAVDVNVDLSIEGGGFSSDGEYLPIVKVAPSVPTSGTNPGHSGLRDFGIHCDKNRRCT